MLDTSAWTRITVDVLKQVNLDPKNVRLELTDEKVDADIMAYLFANEDVLSLVEGICKIGYLTHEIPVVIKSQTIDKDIDRRNHYIVVEGNRRFAALKAIQNPLLVPRYKARISKFTSTLTDAERKQYSRVQVMVAPSLDEAEQLIAPLHTSNLRKAWNPKRQAAFFQKQIDSGRTLEELKKRYPTINVKKFVFRASVFNLFKGVKYDNPDLRDYIESKQWAKSSSVLARIYESKDFRNLTGLNMDDQGHVSVKIADKQFKDLATIIVNNIRLGNINTRTLNSTKSDTFVALMSALSRALVTKTANNKSDLSISSLKDNSTSESENTNSTSTRENPNNNLSGDIKDASRKQHASFRTDRRRAHYLDFTQINPPAEYPDAVKSLLYELSSIDVLKFPNITFIAIRSALEKSIKAFAKFKGENINQSNDSKGSHVQLYASLRWLLGYAKTNNRDLIQPIENCLSTRLATYSKSKDAMDAAIHNQLFLVDPDQVFNTWSSITPIMEYVMDI